MLNDTQFDCLKLSQEDGIALVQLDHPKSTNPFSSKMNQTLIRLAPELDSDETIQAIVITGGEDRSFSVGGDFTEVSQLREREKIRSYVLVILDLYVSILRISKPVVAAIDHYAIGQGFQVALLADWKIASDRAQLQMPELKNGVACPLGSLMLELLLGRARMLRYVIQCDVLAAAEALDIALVDEVVPPGELIEKARAKARYLAGYARTPFRTTKQIHNRRFIQAIEDIREEATEAHVLSVLSHSGDAHFQKVLGIGRE